MLFFLFPFVLFWGCSGGSGDEPTADSFSQNFVSYLTDGSKLRTLLPTDEIIDSMIKCPGENQLKTSIERLKTKISKMKVPKGATIGYKSNAVKESLTKKKGDDINGCQATADFNIISIEVDVEKRMGDKSEEDKLKIQAISMNGKWYLADF